MVSTRLRVKELLRERRWTTKVLAEKTGMSESYLTHIKNGTRRWNEDALKKLAEAFEIDPTAIFAHVTGTTTMGNSAPMIQPAISGDISEITQSLDLKLTIIPVVGQIPEHPSKSNNNVIQQATGFAGHFFPVLGDFENPENMFAYCIPDNTMAPQFVKGDYAVICPSQWTNSGDIVAVEYGSEDQVNRDIMQVNFMEDFVVLETVNHKKSPIALMRGKDQFRIIGKVVARHQKLA